MTISYFKKLFHFKQPAITSRGVYTVHQSYYIRIEQNGVVGVGECSVLPDLSCDAMPDADYEAVLSNACTLLRTTGEIPYRELHRFPSILFGMETAMLQLCAKGSLALSNTPFARGEAGIPINGLVWMGTPEEMSVRIEEKLRAGFHCVKLKIGAIDWAKEIELIRYIRDRFTKEEIELRVDANGGFTPENAMARLEELAKYDIHSIEQPIRQHQWEAMAYLCRHSPLPIALDEELIGVSSKSRKRELLDAVEPAYIVLKPSLHGGMYGTKEWIEIANERGIGSWITSALESNVGLNAVAHLCAEVYGPDFPMSQGLGTGQLYTDNIDMPLEIRGEYLWFLGE